MPIFFYIVRTVNHLQEMALLISKGTRLSRAKLEIGEPSLSFLGMCILTVSVSVPAFKPSECVGSVCPSATPPQYAMLFGGLYLVAIGTGGIKPCVSPMGADQFDDTDPRERVKKGSFFNWFYFSLNIGSLVASTFIVWIQENVGWGLGFGIPTLFMGIAALSFLSGTLMYRFRRPGGSPFTRMCQVIVASLRKRKFEVPQDCSLLYEISDQHSAVAGSQKLEHTDELKFLDKACILSDSEMTSPVLSDPWRLWNSHGKNTWILHYPSSLPNHIPYAHRFDLSTIIRQASRASSSEIYQKTKGVFRASRMGIGLTLSILPMICAALVELRRLQLAKELGLVDETGPVPLSIFWQIPQYLLLGMADVFTYVGQLEFFYDESPDAMRSLGTALCLLETTVGSYFSSLILTIVTSVTSSGGKPGWIPDNLNKGQLYNYFWLWAALSFLNLLLYVFFALKYKQKKAL
ncbi:hypothetical protein KSS87_023884 [Heliosperma pusillum]|nr:hypothetical protein KSS87_023884 [Heliosperma pusillum]